MKQKLRVKLQGPLSDTQWAMFKELCDKSYIEMDEYAANKLTGNYHFARNWFLKGWKAKKRSDKLKKVKSFNGYAQ
jgi:hypothetical protein